MIYPTKFKQANGYAELNGGAKLWAYRDKKAVVTRWKFSFMARLRILFGLPIWMKQDVDEGEIPDFVVLLERVSFKFDEAAFKAAQADAMKNAEQNPKLQVVK